MKKQLAATLALIAIAVAQPASAGPFDAGAVDHQVGAVAALRFRLPLGSAPEEGRLGLTMNLQHRYITGDRGIRRLDVEGLELALGPSGPIFYAGGANVARLGDSLGAASGDEKNSPWGTIGLVVAGAALIGGAYFLHVINESEENSD